MRFLPASDKALLVELDDLAQTMALYRHVAAQRLPGVQELVPAARTLLVHFEPHVISPSSLIDILRALGAQAAQALQSAEAVQGRLVDIPVRYTGEDLPDVAELLGISVAQVIERHTAQPYDAAFAGFAPGFVYLSGGANFQIPRRQSPRTKVPAGSVALGGNFSAVYPSASPGGWQLIGVTDVPMWDLQRP
ncbi:MAG: allophanate hydrolase subunit 1, partial [Comamonas sp.]